MSASYPIVWIEVPHPHKLSTHTRSYTYLESTHKPCNLNPHTGHILHLAEREEHTERNRTLLFAVYVLPRTN